MSLFERPLSDSKFALNALEFIGLIGGREVISVMTMIPLYRGRRWLDWFNTPGSLDIARHLADFAGSFRIRPYRNQSPAALLGLDNEIGPQFVGAFSGLKVQTGHVEYLMFERTKELSDRVDEISIKGRRTKPVTVILLEVDPRKVDLDRPFPLLHITHTLLALIPITTSVITCLLCGFVSDWYMFSVILVGMFTSGFASMVIGSGRLMLRAPMSFMGPETPPGHGIATSVADNDTVIVVRGSGHAIDVITRGKFELRGDEVNDELLGDEHWQKGIRLCALFYLVECVAQLVLIPQGSLFGQIMFIFSLCVSWAYSYRLASFKKERLQAELLFNKLGEPRIQNFTVGTRTTTGVFTCLLLSHGAHHLASPSLYHQILSAILPNDTPVWRRWRDKVIKQLMDRNDESFPYLKLHEEDHMYNESAERLLVDLLSDAVSAFQGYLSICGSLSSASFTGKSDY